MGKMRFRHSKGIPLSTFKSKHPVGRPKKEEGGAVHRKIRISGKLLNMILAYQESELKESYNDTILRMLDRKTHLIITQSEEIKALERENLKLKESLGK
jgi:hypothetical protein